MTRKGEYDLEVANLPRVGDLLDPPEKQVSRFRVILPQVLAGTAKNLLLLDLGLTVAFPTIAIATLLNATGDDLSLTPEQASWLGSIYFICQPLGSVLSGMLMEPLGRKRSMILVNFPHIIGWFMLYCASSVTMLYSALIIMGLGIGFMEAPILTYVGEITQPEIRGILTSYSSIFVQLGFFIEYLFGTVMHWRTAAAISAVVPIITVLAITQVPETPMWLLSKGRVKEAEESLCWLRGWVQPAAVQVEFQEMLRYSKESNKKKKNPDAEGTLISGDSFLRKMKELFKPTTLRPLLLVCGFFLFHHASGLPGIRPFMVQIFDDFGLPLDAHWATVFSALIGIIGNIVCMVIVKYTGKRPLSLVSLGICALSCIALGMYAYYAILPGASAASQQSTWAPLVLFITLTFAFNFGVGPIPWMLLSEVFPFKSRGLASGVAAAIAYILGFVVSKTFLDLRTNLHLHGVFWLYGIAGLVGFVFLFFCLKETEGKSLEDIEDHYRKVKKPGVEEGNSQANGIGVSTITLVSHGSVGDIPHTTDLGSDVIKR